MKLFRSPRLLATCLLALDLLAPLHALAQTDVARVDRLLEVTHARDAIDKMLPQVAQLQKQMMTQALAGRQLTAEQQVRMERVQQIVYDRTREMLTWEKLQPIYRDIYGKSFNDADMDAMIAFYGSPAGQRVIEKMPVALQNTMLAVQQMLVPVMQDMERDIDAALDAPAQDDAGAPTPVDVPAPAATPTH